MHLNLPSSLLYWVLSSQLWKFLLANQAELLSPSVSIKVNMSLYGGGGSATWVLSHSAGMQPYLSSRGAIALSGCNLIGQKELKSVW